MSKTRDPDHSRGLNSDWVVILHANTISVGSNYVWYFSRREDAIAFITEQAPRRCGNQMILAEVKGDCTATGLVWLLDPEDAR